MQPTFPPLLTGHVVGGSKDAFSSAVSGAARGTYGAGDLVWCQSGTLLDYALVLEPTVDRVRCHEMLFTAMVAFGDSLGALGPPELAVTYLWPSQILINDAVAGTAKMAVSEQETEKDLPDWLVVGIALSLRPAEDDPDPGYRPDQTSLSEEGCGDLTRAVLLESNARHLLTWIHTWQEEGFKPIHTSWSGRMAERDTLSVAYEGRDLQGPAVGLDEHGGLLLEVDGETRLLLTELALRS